VGIALLVVGVERGGVEDEGPAESAVATDVGAPFDGFERTL